MLPNPATTTTTKQIGNISRPIDGVSPIIGAERAPAKPAKYAPRPNVYRNTTLTLMPRTLTISLFSIPARKIAPKLVFVRNK